MVALMGRWHPWVMFTWDIMNSREFPFSSKRDSVWPPVCLDRHTKKIKGFKVNVVAFEELRVSPSEPPPPPPVATSPSLPYTCLFIFSFFPSPTIPRVCCGPESCSWSSANLERSSAFLEIWEERTHEIGCKPSCSIHKLFICTTNTLSLYWFITLLLATRTVLLSERELWTAHEWVNKVR